MLIDKVNNLEALSRSNPIIGESQFFRAWEPVRIFVEGRLFRLYLVRPAQQSATAPPGYVLKTPKATAEQSIARIFLAREVEVSQCVVHPRIISILAWHLGEPAAYVVMPYLPGQALPELIRRGRLTLETTLGIARQIAEGLVALDEAGWWHGDLKPSNVHVGIGRQVTLLDLGFARRPGEQGDHPNGPWGCTPLYLAPELLSSRGLGDIRSDLYSLGVVMYEMLTGGPPYAFGSPEDLSSLRATIEVPPLRMIRNDVPVRLEQFIRKLLSKNPLRRPQRAREVLEELIDFEVQAICQVSSSGWRRHWNMIVSRSRRDADGLSAGSSSVQVSVRP